MLSSNKSELRIRKRKGFSLLEIVMSLGLIALFTIPLGNMVLGTVKINKAAEDKQQSGVLLQETIEYIKQENLPAGIGDSIILGNNVKIERAEDTRSGEEAKPTFIVTSEDNSYGISINGTIIEKSVISNSNNIISEKVDGAVYFSGNEQGKITVANREMTTDEFSKDIINGGSLLFSSVVGNKLTINSDNENMSLADGTLNQKELSKFENNALLVILDNDKAKLQLDITNKHQSKKLKIYLYNKKKTTEASDIGLTVHSQGRGSKDMGVEVITIIASQDGSQSSEMKLYSVELSAVKSSKTLENITVDLMK